MLMQAMNDIPPFAVLLRRPVTMYQEQMKYKYDTNLQAM